MEKCRRGDIFMVELDKRTTTSIQSGKRPVLVISNDKNNKYSPVVWVVPITSKLKKKSLPTHVALVGCGLSKESQALAEQTSIIDKKNLTQNNFICNVNDKRLLDEISNAIRIQVS